MATIRVYTGGTGIGNHFPLSESVHLSLLQDGQMEAPLNDGYGMLFATSIILPDQTIAERLLKSRGLCPPPTVGASLHCALIWKALKRTRILLPTGRQRIL